MEMEFQNQLDTDSDNDGCPDAVEAGNGQTVDMNDMIPGGVDPVTGIPIAVGGGQPTAPAVITFNPDFDGDGEAGLCEDDSDGDGVPDTVDACPGFDDTIDFDGDGIPDACDLDDDNDGITNIEEGCVWSVVDFGIGTVGAGTITGATTTNGVVVNTTWPGNAPFALSNRNRGTTWFDNAAYTFATAGPLQANQFFYSNILDSGTTSDTVVFDFTGDPVQQVYLHVNSLDQLRGTFDTAANPGIGVAILSGNDFDIQIIGTTFSVGDNRIEPADDATDRNTPQEEEDDPNNRSADFTLHFFSTNGLPITQINLGFIEVIASNTNLEGGNYAMEVLAGPDFDGDTIPNCLDLDADNDGIYDVVESGGVDADNDGIADGIDSNDDGIPDSAGTGNTPTNSGPGNPDYINYDSDGDGCSDANEAYSDANADGGDGNQFGIDPAPINGDGTVTAAPYTDPNVVANDFPSDSDGNGTLDYQESGPDTDNDLTANACDEDDDGDGNPDVTDPNPTIPTVEDDANMTDAGVAVTTDVLVNDDYLGNNDGPLGTTTLTDTGLGNAMGIVVVDPDTGEITYTPTLGESGMMVTIIYEVCSDDGVTPAPDNPVCMQATLTITVGDMDSDNDGVNDVLDLDDDNDGILDTDESPGLPDPSADDDMDGIPNYQDIDIGVDGNMDGVVDGYDFDGDGVPNHLDLDADNDGIYDVDESGGVDTDNDGQADDTDGDSSNNNGVPNSADNGNGNPPIDSDPANADGPDFLDTDSDGDGCNDANEAYQDNTADGGDGGQFGMGDPLTVTGGMVNTDGTVTAAPYDTGVVTDVTTVGPDLDNDGQADICDEDDDGDGNPDVTDPNPTIPTVEDDANMTDAGVAVTTDVLVNDDYLGNNDGPLGTTTLIDTGLGNAMGIVVVDPDTGEITYTPTLGESGMMVTIVYEVCSDDGMTPAPDNPVCMQATLTITVGDMDSDGDGINDVDDVDDDNDGIADVDENPTGVDPSADDDMDGVPNYLDDDPMDPMVGNDDGEIEDGFDADNDGIPNHLDLDSDNDGITDVVETGNGDLDTDNDGDIDADDTGFTDNDNDGQSDNTAGTIPENTDGNPNDGPDFLDIDADDDGIPDNVEAQDTDDYTPPSGDDNNMNGIDDAYENGGYIEEPTDTDGDDTPDYLDTDSDNDNVSDMDEAGQGEPTGMDTDGDGLDDGYDDSDDTGMEPDVNDNLDTGAEGTDNDDDPSTDEVDFREIMDSDGDGIPDVVDVDDDNDGIADVDENPTGVDPSADDDMDGVPNYLDDDPMDPMVGNDDGEIEDGFDADNDGIPNHLDLDSDNDGITDVVETGNGDLDTDNDGDIDADDTGFTDNDNDGQSDNTAGTVPENTDGNPNDGPDFLDIDADDDGIPDNVEAQDTDDYTPPSGDDNNMNGIDDAYENGGYIEEPTDTDGDDTPDYLDTDSDNDNVSDMDEAGQGEPTGMDTDGDGLDDGYDDSDDTGMEPDVNDNLDTGAEGTDNDDDPSTDEVDFREIMDSDGDGIPDVVDVDDDNDGIADVDENPTGVDPSADDDMDGVPNYLDDDPMDPMVGNDDGEIEDGFDADGDGVPNHFDLDADNDGIHDIVESGKEDLDTDGDGDVDADDDVFADTNMDGQADNSEGNTPTDTLNDGSPDFLNQDSDADGCSDANEAYNDPNADGGDGGSYSTPEPPLVNPDGTVQGAPYDTGFVEAVTIADTDIDGDGVVGACDLDDDGDGVTDEQEEIDGTDPNDPCDLVIANQTLPTEDVFNDADCDNDGLTNEEEITGVDDPMTPADPDGNMTDPLDPDTDGDGVTDGDEAIDGTDPNDPCDLIVASQTETPDDVFNNADCDGDGVPNDIEINTDNTDPLDPCDYNPVNQDITTVSAEYNAEDCDNDGLNNGEEITGVDDPDTPADPDGNMTDPLDPDTDGDGVNDGDEANDGTDPNDPCDLIVASQTETPDASWGDLDCDNDGLSNDEEIAAGTDPLDPDTDGDGVIDGDEVNDGTDPLDPCSLELASQTVDPTMEWNDLDCDNDGLNNGEEITGVDDPDTPADPDGNMTDPLDPDTDGDGVNDGDEAEDGTDPLDPCSLELESQTIEPSGDFLEADCDGDGIPNGEELGDEDDDGTPDFQEENNGDPDAQDGLEVFDIMSPNGDGLNDVFVIRGIEQFPNNTVRIYNRWGVLVFDTRGYGQDDNFFRGESNGRVTVDQDRLLPVGTYYYVLEYTNSEGRLQQLAGPLYINR